MLVRVKDRNVLHAEVLTDQNDEFGLYVTPADGKEVCISEKELRAAVKAIDQLKGA